MKSVQVSNIVYISTLSMWHKKVLTRKDFELINIYNNQVLACTHFIKFYIKFAYLLILLIMYTLCVEH